MEPSVDILLGTYNGARFLEEQLRSIEEQTWASWRLIARDDGSTDGTRSILAEFAAKHAQRTILLEPDGQRLGAAGNFHRLLECSTAEFVAFCDQDDVWRPYKIEHLLRIADRNAKPGVPLLVHSDLEVVDDCLRPVASSFWKFQKIDPKNCQWSRLLVQNVVTGSACLCNATLRDVALPIPADAIMHDWWLALVASVTGEIHYTTEPTVLYRQHGRNDTGAKRWGAGYVLKHLPELWRPDSLQSKLRRYQRQASQLARLPSGRVSADVRHALAEFSEIDRLSLLGRVRLLLRHRILKTGWLRNLALVAWI